MDILTVFIGYSIKKNVLKVRKTIFEKMMDENSYRLIGGDIFVMKGAHPNETEIQTAEKVVKNNDFFLLFPNDGQIKEIRELNNEPGERRNDIFLIDKKTYKAIMVDIKTCGDPSPETIKAHLLKGSSQAPNIVLDITGKISKANLTVGLRRGWSKGLNELFLNYHGRWYTLDRKRVFDKKWITDNVK